MLTLKKEEKFKKIPYLDLKSLTVLKLCLTVHFKFSLQNTSAVWLPLLYIFTKKPSGIRGFKL